MDRLSCVILLSHSQIPRKNSLQRRCEEGFWRGTFKSPAVLLLFVQQVNHLWAWPYCILVELSFLTVPAQNRGEWLKALDRVGVHTKPARQSCSNPWFATSCYSRSSVSHASGFVLLCLNCSSSFQSKPMCSQFISVGQENAPLVPGQLLD